jgi:uncharacterized protein
MVALTTEISESLTGTRTLFLATASQNRMPNVVPIGAFKLLDSETLLISDQFFKKTLQNMVENPVAALSWWGEKGGFQIKGPITIHTNDEIFLRDVAWMKEIRPNLTPKSAIVMKIAEVYQVKPGTDAGKKIL